MLTSAKIERLTEWIKIEIRSLTISMTEWDSDKLVNHIVNRITPDLRCHDKSEEQFNNEVAFLIDETQRQLGIEQCEPSNEN